jgi:hypothetical protein
MTKDPFVSDVDSIAWRGGRRGRGFYRWGIGADSYTHTARVLLRRRVLFG